MKAVLLAGGLGTRMREETEFRPKPMVEIGGKPVLWHIMKVLASQGITEFIVCTGYKSEQIKSYFLNYMANTLDFTVRLGEESRTTFHGQSDGLDWTVTVAYTGAETSTGGRLKMVEKYLEGERFLCTYGDGIADIDLQALIAFHESHGQLATLTTTNPPSRFGIIETDSESRVLLFKEKPLLEEWVNIGYFLFERSVFDYLRTDQPLEEGALPALSKDSKLYAFRHAGFWQPMDTYREAQILNSLWNSGAAPWKIWKETLS
jgi:glucose-1-phosphate cytidylyltransferase